MPDVGDVARMKRIVERVRARGVRVIFVPDWDKRGATFPVVPNATFVHHDASSTSSGTWGAIGIITHGRTGVPPPLSQFQVARGSTPQLAVIAAGIANHAGLGGPRIGIPQNAANRETYGMEVANNGGSEPYSAATLKAISVLQAGILEEIKEPVRQCIGHKEWTSRKIDPVYSMDWMRQQVADVMAGAGAGEEDMSEVMDFLKTQFRDFVRKDKAGKVIWRRSVRQAILDGHTGLVEQRKHNDATTKALAAQSSAIKALAEQHQDIAGLPALVADLDAAVDKLNDLPLATALVREEEEPTP